MPRDTMTINAKTGEIPKSLLIQFILDQCRLQGLTLLTQQAFLLALVDATTQGTFQPVEDVRGGTKDRFYYGRGLTIAMEYYHNYYRYSKILGIDLVQSPELALDPKIASFILVHGVTQGHFTGDKITDYINGNQSDYFNAVRCVDPTLKNAQKIVDLTQAYLGRFSDGL